MIILSDKKEAITVCSSSPVGNRLRRWLTDFGRCSLFGLLTGVIGGVSGAALLWSVEGITHLREAQPWTLWLLPITGLLIALLYHLAKLPFDNGTRRIVLAARGKTDVPLSTAAVVFLSTVISHFGGSTGREGAAMEMGGSVGGWLAKRLRLDERYRQRLMAGGMASAFSGGLGTPLTAALLAAELTGGIRSVWTVYTCFVSAAVGYGVRLLTGAPLEPALPAGLPSFDWQTLLTLIGVAVITAAIGFLFRLVMWLTGRAVERVNPFLRIAVAGTAVVALTLLVGNGDYNGSGMTIVHRTIATGEAVWYACLLKIVFTTLTLQGGYRGGEVVPSLCVGATAGCAAAILLGISPVVGTTVGAVMVFGGMTGCPLAAIAIGWELFGGRMGWTLLPAAVAVIGFTWLLKKRFNKKTD